MKKIARWVCIVAGATLAGLLLVGLYPLIADTVMHNRNLARMTTSFTLLEHPPQTERVVLRKLVGLLRGNGNHCDYFVGELRTYDGNTNSVVTWYSEKKIDDPTGTPTPVEVFFLKNGTFVDPDACMILPVGHDAPSNWLYPAPNRTGEFYLVFCLLVGFEEAGADWRCH